VQDDVYLRYIIGQMRPIGESGVTVEAAAHLRDAIREGRLPPGARIVERPVARELGISPIAVREALARLTQEGWVERLPRRGARVRDPDTGELDDITSARVLVEGEALARASAALDPAAERELRGLLAEMDGAARHGDRSALLACDEAFHLALWRASASPTLEELLRNLTARIIPLVRRSIDGMAPGELGAMRGWHEELLDAVLEGPEAARAAAAAHAELTRTRVRAGSHRQEGT
jgi:DNA-binding GntR family transcriptional regulator